MAVVIAMRPCHPLLWREPISCSKGYVRNESYPATILALSCQPSLARSNINSMGWQDCNPATLVFNFYTLGRDALSKGENPTHPAITHINYSGALSSVKQPIFLIKPHHFAQCVFSLNRFRIRAQPKEIAHTK